jgi:hypothetical protein
LCIGGATVLNFRVMQEYRPEGISNHRPEDSAPGAHSVVEYRRKHAPRVHSPAAFRVCEVLTEALLYIGLVFGPWALGTTEPWSTWIMNWMGYTLGGLLLARTLICWRSHYTPEKWAIGGGSSKEGSIGSGESFLPRVLTGTLVALNILILLYCLVSALNARATYVYEERRQVYYDQFLSFLPHSYDSRATWYVFWQYLGLSFFFWSARDWLLTKSRQERHFEERTMDGVRTEPAQRMPDRLKRLLWVLSLNGAILGIEGIMQRFSGTTKLLWMVEPVFLRAAESQFGPFNYRSNAAQYFNLLWPATLGFWWCLNQEKRLSRFTRERLGGGASILLLPCTVIMAACPIISISRGGALVSLGQMIGAMALLLGTANHVSWRHRLGVAAIFISALALVTGLGWSPLVERLKLLDHDELGGRQMIYENSQQMLEDYPVFGSGPGTFSSIYQYYREDLTQEWSAQMHDDWLETRITFGWVGFVLVLAPLIMVLLQFLWGAGIPVRRELILMLWLAIAGCLAHAKFDFPLQVHSILTLFLTACVILSSSNRRG